jgi:hypothetical protein
VFGYLEKVDRVRTHGQVEAVKGWLHEIARRSIILALT